MVVYVQKKDGKPMMPCSNVIGRLLLKNGKARVVMRCPFTIRLNYKLNTEHVQKLVLKVDAGSTKVGTAVSDKNGNIYYMSEVELRTDITKKMKRRNKYRRNRRYRKCRRRPCRFLNRKNSRRKERFSPTVKSKIEGTLHEIEFVEKILPIEEVIVEAGTFDPHALKNPEVLKNPLLYQQGLKYGFYNAKAYTLWRDGYKCQHCKGRSKDERLHCHHIIFRENGGSDEPENLIVLCETCHDEFHEGKFQLNLKGKKGRTLKDATQMNSIRKQVLKRSGATETFGYITKAHREQVGLPKTHYFDAVMCGSPFIIPNFRTEMVLFKKCIPKGDYQQTKGVRSQQRIPTGKICGFRKFDKVEYLGGLYFIKGRMSSGYAKLMEIDGVEVKFKPMPKFSQLKRVSARSSRMMIEHPIHLAPKGASILGRSG